mmetsp:Transcript_16333/g.28613  ORF Transcript_16333/g.28613 Transcript_16333/m.28613 type:complete len:332 (+) Transcript_16333:137-1132(+)
MSMAATRNTHGQPAYMASAMDEITTWHKAVVEGLISWCQALERLPSHVRGADGIPMESNLQNELRDKLLSEIHALMLLSVSNDTAAAASPLWTGITDVSKEPEVESFSSLPLAPLPEEAHENGYPTLLAASRSRKSSRDGRGGGASKEDTAEGRQRMSADSRPRTAPKKAPSQSGSKTGRSSRPNSPESSRGGRSKEEDDIGTSITQNRTSTWTPRRRSVDAKAQLDMKSSQLSSDESASPKRAVSRMPPAAAVTDAPRARFQMPAFAGIRTLNPPRSPVRRQGSLRRREPSRSQALVMLAESLQHQLVLNGSQNMAPPSARFAKSSRSTL